MLFVVLNLRQEFDIMIDPLGEAKFTISIKLTDTTEMVKQKIKDITAVEPWDYELMYREKKMDIGVSMQAYYLEPNSKIYLVSEHI